MPRRRPPPKPRQRRGSGSISLHSKSGRWRVNLPTRLDPTRRTTYFATEAEGRAWLVAEIARLEQGEAITVGGPSQPLWQYLESWLSTRRLGRQTEPYYRRAVRHAEPLWDVPLSDLTPRHFSRLWAALSGTHDAPGLAHSTIGQIRAVLGAALHDAVLDGLLAQSPINRRSRSPTPAPPTWQPWDADDVARFLSVSDHDQEAAFWRLLLATGCRPAEARGLQWADLNLSAGSATIQRSLSEGRYGQGRQRAYHQGPTKTKRSRTIQLDPATLEALREHRAAQQPLRRWVFSGPSGEPRSSKYFSARFQRLRRQAGCAALHLYGLRHSYCVQRLADGVPIMAVSATLGHSNPATTMRIYAKYLASHQVLATASVERQMPEFRAKKQR